MYELDLALQNKRPIIYVRHGLTEDFDEDKFWNTHIFGDKQVDRATVERWRANIAELEKWQAIRNIPKDMEPRFIKRIVSEVQKKGKQIAS